MSEGFANNALYERASVVESERTEWAKKLAPIPEHIRAQRKAKKNKHIGLFRKIFGL